VLLWRTLHPSLLRYLRVRGDHHPEDVAAETWLQVARGLARFEGDVAAFRAWLFTIARNRATDEGRARARRPAQVLMADPHLGVRSPAEPSAEDLADENAATERALQLVGTLPPLQAEVVLLRVVAGLDVADVAAILGRPPGTVRVMVHRALRSLAERVPSPGEAALS
jgi:RNA polymerase sigma-70 factor, ECF subfamily